MVRRRLDNNVVYKLVTRMFDVIHVCLKWCEVKISHIHRLVGSLFPSFAITVKNIYVHYEFVLKCIFFRGNCYHSY